MTIQLDMFREVVTPIPAPEVIQEGNILVLVAPTLYASGAEALERRAARIREIEAQKQEKKELAL